MEYIWQRSINGFLKQVSKGWDVRLKISKNENCLGAVACDGCGCHGAWCSPFFVLCS